MKKDKVIFRNYIKVNIFTYKIEKMYRFPDFI